MHLKNRPVYFVKDGNRRAVYYTVDARELAADGWEIEQPAPAPAPVPEPEMAQVEPVEVGAPVTELVDAPELDLDGMTRAELIEFAEANGIEFKSNASKADILEACKEFVDD